MAGMYRSITVGERMREVILFSASCGTDDDKECQIRQYSTVSPDNKVDVIYLRSPDGTETTYVRDPKKDSEAADALPSDGLASRRTIFKNAQKSMDAGLDLADRLITGLLATVQQGPADKFKDGEEEIYVQCQPAKNGHIGIIFLLNPSQDTVVTVQSPQLLASFEGKIRCG